MTPKTEPITNLPETNMPQRILLGPGPSMAHPRVLKAMATPLVGTSTRSLSS